MPKKNLGYYMRESKKQGVSQGMDFMAGILFLALNNLIEDYVEAGKRGEFMRETEKEMNRIYSEVLDSVPNGEIDEMAERIVFYVEQYRKKWEMDKEESDGMAHGE